MDKDAVYGYQAVREARQNCLRRLCWLKTAHAPCRGLVTFHVVAAERTFDARIRLWSCAQEAVRHSQPQLPMLRAKLHMPAMYVAAEAWMPVRSPGYHAFTL